ncbi:MAG: tyrosine-type recombinase/integrase [Beijerinckiaceae bacterium]|nr:tyrosine-type recombinase/integrase [Beijerinckiaceae bacterium]
MMLSDLKIRTAKPQKRIQKLSDGRGLQLWIMPNGSKLWRVAYRIGGKQKLLALGAYPHLGLAEARIQCGSARQLLLDGKDPVQEKAVKKLTRLVSAANTYALIAEELIDKKRLEGKSPATLGKIRWLHGIAISAIGNRPITEITAPEILAILKKVESREQLETAKRLRGVIGEVFRYAMATARAVADPTSALRGAIRLPKPKHFAAITDPREFGGLLRAINGFEGQPTTVAALKLLALLFPRPGELRQAKWSEFDFEKATWSIPAERMKSRALHVVPLSQQAISILTELKMTSNEADELVFRGLRSRHRPISENTLNGALRRMGYGQDEMTSHGFRSTASTILNESGRWSADSIERALAHADKNAIRGIYNRGKYLSERADMMQWWADHLDTIVKL